jgi:cell division protein FtsB
MNKKTLKKSNFFVILTFISLALILGIYLLVSFSQNKEVAKKNQSLITNSEGINTLKKDLVNKKEEIEKLNKEIKDLKDMFNITKRKLKICEKKKNEFLKNENPSFFKFLEENINFPNEIIKTVHDYCLKNRVLNLGCAIYVLRSKFNLSYKKESDDKLKGIKEFLKDKGGDCEDWSFFFMQLVNYFKEKENVKYLKILVKDDKDKVVLYRENNYEYILKDYSYLEEDISLLIPTVVCYKVDKERGHCQLAFLNESNPLRPIEGFIIEPQNGIYEGKIKGKEKIYKINGNKKKEIYLLLNEKFWFKEWDFWLSS